MRVKKTAISIKDIAIKKYKKYLFVVEIIFLAAITISYYLAIPMSTSRVIYVPQGSISKIISHMQKSGFSVSGFDSYILRFLGSPQHGWIDIKATRLSKGDFLHKLTTSKAALTSITIIPGDTLYITIQNLSNILGLNEDALFRAYNKYAPFPDGVIVPETYNIPVGISANHLMYYLVNTSINSHKKLSKKILGEYDKNQWFKYLTIASIIEKEAANEQEMPLVSAVIYNRLKKGMPLQMDGALNYGKFSNQKVTAKRLRSDNSQFNTYKNRGLPSYPVCAVSIDAIKAAINPANVDYLYFVKGKDGKHNFSKSYNQHLYNIRNGK